MKEESDATAVVLDTGSGLMKAGFANQDLPTTIFPTVIGRPKYENVCRGRNRQDFYIGHDAQHMRGILSLHYPLEHGIVTNWDEIEKIMFEVFNVPFSYVAMQAVLALYSSGRTTGITLDSGDGVTHTVPVYEGYSLPHAVQRLNLAGRDLTEYLRKLLKERGYSFNTSAEQEIVRDIKEKHCYVAEDYEAELGGLENGEELNYTLPDGQIITIGNERFRAPEILFRPEVIGRDHYGIHESLLRAIILCDVDLRQTFAANIILSGGNTMLTGLSARVQKEISSMLPLDLSKYVHVTSPANRDFTVWSGGAALANSSAIECAWINREEYYEFGPKIVHRKCF
ncbi:actin, aortic smooth muscle isoform X4 [Cetorhinus maximus]